MEIVKRFFLHFRCSFVFVGPENESKITVNYTMDHVCVCVCVIVIHIDAN